MGLRVSIRRKDEKDTFNELSSIKKQSLSSGASQTAVHRQIGRLFPWLMTLQLGVGGLVIKVAASRPGVLFFLVCLVFPPAGQRSGTRLSNAESEDQAKFQLRFFVFHLL
ncbi:hypothetical protein TB2_039388 [Malus domestica]